MSIKEDFLSKTAAKPFTTGIKKMEKAGVLDKQKPAQQPKPTPPVTSKKHEPSKHKLIPSKVIEVAKKTPLKEKIETTSQKDYTHPQPSEGKTKEPPLLLTPITEKLAEPFLQIPTQYTDVTGTPLTTGDIEKTAKQAPQNLTPTQKREWAIEQLTYTPPSKTPEPTTAYKKYRVTPDQSMYQKEQQKIQETITQGKTTLTQLQKFKEEFPQYEKQYKSQLSQIESSTPSTIWGVDIDQSGTIEENELFTRNIAIQKFKELHSNYQQQKKLYQNIDETINQMRMNIANAQELSTTLTMYQQAGYGLKKTPEGYQFTQLTPKETYKKLHKGSERTDIFVAKQLMSLGIPAAINYAMGRWDKYEQEEYARLLELKKQPSEETTSYTARFWTSPEAIESTWLPLTTMGLGYTVKGLEAGYQVGRGLTTGGRIASAISGFGTTTTGQILSKGIKIGMLTAGTVGVTMAGMQLYQTAQEQPEQLGTAIGHLTSSTILALGGYYVGGKMFAKHDVPLKTTPEGKLKPQVKLLTEDIQVKTGTGETTIGMVKGYGEVFFEGVKPRTGRTYYFRLEGTGRGGKMIGENIQVSRSSGFFRNIAGKKIGAFEAYGKHTTPMEIQKGLTISSERFVSATYGRTPQVYTGKGLHISTTTGYKTPRVIDVSMGGKTPVYATAKTITKPHISIGEFQSELFQGRYFSRGVSQLVTGFKKGKITFLEKPPTFWADETATMPLFKKLSGWQTIPKTSSITGTLVSETLSSTIPTITHTPTPVSISTIGLGVSQAISTVGLTGLSGFKTRGIQQQVKQQYHVGLKPVKTQRMIQPEILTIQQTEKKLVQKQIHRNITMTPSVKTIQKPTTVSVQKTQRIPVQKMMQIPTVKQIQKTQLKTTMPKTPSQQKITITSIPSTMTPDIPVVTPPPIPVIEPPRIRGQGGDYGYDWFWGKTKKHREQKIINPFTMDKFLSDLLT